MVELRSPDYYDDETYDNCGNTTMAVLKCGSITIPLCNDCLSSLRKSLKKYDETVHCYQCANFIMSTSGFNYGGSCLKSLSDEEKKNFKKSNAGYDSCVDCLNTCSDSVAKINIQNKEIIK